MRIRVDLESDALYFRIAESAIEESEEVSPGVIVDYDKSGRVVGVEVLNVKERFSKRDLSHVKVDIPALSLR